MARRTRTPTRPPKQAPDPAAERRSARLKALKAGLQTTWQFTPLVSLGQVHAAIDGVLRRAGVTIVDGAETDADGNGAVRLHHRVDLNEYADSVVALIPGDVYVDFEERADCAPPSHTRFTVLATDAEACERVAAALAGELAVFGCVRVA